MVAPTKLNQKLIDELIHHINRGVAIKYAAPACGINTATYYNWMHKGEKDTEKGENTLESRLFDSISKAKSDFIQTAIANIQKAGRTSKNWQANTWLLERLYAAAYGKEAEEVQKLAKDIETIKEILGANADPFSQHTKGDEE